MTSVQKKKQSPDKFDPANLSGDCSLFRDINNLTAITIFCFYIIYFLPLTQYHLQPRNIIV